MKKFTRILLISLLSVLVAHRAFSAISGSLNSSGYRLLADYIYDLQKFSDSQNGVLCVYGSDDVASSILARYGDVVALRDTHAKKCKLIYIAEDQERYLKSIMEDFNNQKIATVSFIDQFLENNGTFLVIIGRNGKMKLQLNPKVKTLGIKISPLLLNFTNNQ